MESIQLYHALYLITILKLMPIPLFTMDILDIFHNGRNNLLASIICPITTSITQKIVKDIDSQPISSDNITEYIHIEYTNGDH
jgi:hypothetical protein